KGSYAPVAARTRNGETTWVRPLAGGQRAPPPRVALAGALGAEKALLGAGELTVQRFMDQKSRRAGFGDVVFVPRGGPPADGARRAQLRRLVSTLDPSLVPAPPPAATPKAPPSSEAR